ncbi:TolC family protein [Bacteroides sp. 224]|uniref:TolC family protein n=1 Tax=Bacteroides sp. 224 TaxID=2302936 RepID=UPI0013D1BD34|nr:TolC family protein [Bacteroides sp. 224]NDV65277.1 TolC family protein [Bacteroides sp. 224]
MRRIYLYICLLICLPGIVNAQQTYTLKSCLETGLANNYSIRISRNEEQVNKNNATLANAGFLPTLDLTGSYKATIDNTETTVRATGEKAKDSGVFDQTFNAGLALNWTIFDGFKISTNYQRLKELEKQGETNTRIAVEDFIANLTAEYYNHIQQKIRLKNLKYAVSLSKERVRIVEARYNIGSFSRLDLQQARVDFNADSSQYMKQQELLNTSRITLNELMANHNVDEMFFVPDSAIDVNMTLIYNDLWEGTMNTNASLIKAEQNNMLAQLDQKIVNARNYPYLRLNSGYGYTLYKYDIAANKQRSNWGFNGGVTVGINLFDGNRSRERKNARIAIENARLQRQQLELNLQADMANLWQAYQNNIEVLKLEQENLIAAKENHTIAMDRYMLGDLSGFEMREAQKSLLDAEERILTAAYNTKLCEISLMQISGKVINYLE